MLIPLILTLLIELTISFFIGVRNKSDFINIFIINCITNPIINYLLIVVMFFIKNNTFYIFLIVFELLVVYFEYLYYKRKLLFNKINLLLLSFILNLLSFLPSLFFI